MQKRNILNLSLSLIVASSLLAACGPVKTPVATNPGGTTGIKPNTPASSNPATPSSSTPSTPSSSTPSTSTSSTASLALTAELQAILADDAAMADTSSAADAGFSTQALNIPVRGEVSATGLIAPRPAVVRAAVRRPAAVNAMTRTKIEAKAKVRAEMARKNKAGLEASGAITVNADGTVTVDPAKLEASVKARLQTRKAEFKARIEKLKTKLEARKEVAKAKVEKMRRKNNVVRSSDVQTTTNDDGSVTKTVSVEFENTKTGVKRTVDSSRTSKDSKLISAHYELHVTGPNGFKRDVVRDVQVAADGTRTATTEATTVWPDGRTHSRSETRVFNADGSASASGALTIKQKDGTTKTYDYTVGVEADGSETVNADDAATTSEEATETVEVTVEDSATTDEVTVIVEEGGTTTEETVEEAADEDVVEVEAAAEGEATTEPAAEGEVATEPAAA